MKKKTRVGRDGDMNLQRVPLTSYDKNKSNNADFCKERQLPFVKKDVQSFKKAKEVNSEVESSYTRNSSRQRNLNGREPLLKFSKEMKKSREKLLNDRFMKRKEETKGGEKKTKVDYSRQERNSNRDGKEVEEGRQCGTPLQKENSSKLNNDSLRSFIKEQRMKLLNDGVAVNATAREKTSATTQPTASIEATPSIVTHVNATVDLAKEDNTKSEKTHIKPSLPLICIGNFQQSLWLDFGDESTNILGKSKSLSFLLQAPPQDKNTDGVINHIVKVEKVPVDKGITLNVDNDEQQQQQQNYIQPITNSFSILSGHAQKFALTWTPVEPGGMRAVVYLKLQRGRLRIIAHGIARSSRAKKKQMPVSKSNKKIYLESSSAPRSNVTTSTNSSNGQNSVTGEISNISKKVDVTNVFESNLELNRKFTPSSEISSLLEKEKNIKNEKIGTSEDEVASTSNDTWADKQCRTFQEWLNFLFHGSNNGGMPVDTEPIQETDGGRRDDEGCGTLRSLLQQRRRAQARHKAMSFYKQPEMLVIQNAIEHEIKSKRLRLKTNPYVLSSVNLRGQLISLLLSYSTPWLCLGLETIFGENIIEEPSPAPVDKECNQLKRPRIKTILKKFIIEKVLSDPDIKMKYTRGKCMVPSGKFEIMYKNEINKHALKIILLLIIFLDNAKIRNVIKSSPRLFNRSGIVKSSKSFLEILCKDYIYGIGDIIKHFGNIGISVSYEQKYIDEVEFPISNLAVDLRDGVRLAKLAEILSGDNESSILQKLRLPAISRLQKLYNTRVALSAFSHLSIPNMDFIEPIHIVDGHRPQVLQFLWSIVSHFKLSTLVDPDELKREIIAVHCANKHRFQHEKTSNDLHKSLDTKKIDRDPKGSDEIADLLLQWCQAVCSCFDVEVNDFSSSFADGKVICFLVHYYHPGILQRNEILPTAVDMMNNVKYNETKTRDPHYLQKYETALENERKNSALANMRMREIGDIPHLLHASDSRTIPDERCTIISVAYLCSRLLESSNEILSAIVIQRAIRKYFSTQLERKLRLKQEEECSVIIQKWLRRHFVIKSFLHMKKQHEAVLNIQAFFRASRVRALLRSYYYTASIIQKVWRGFSCRREYSILSQSILTIQKMYRRILATRAFATRKNAIIRIQCAARQYFAVQQLISIWSEMDYNHRLSVAATRCQAYVRRNIAMRSFCDEIFHFRAALSIQKNYRCHLYRCQFIEYHESAIKIQALWRATNARFSWDLKINSVVNIQTLWRRFSAQVHYHCDLSDITYVQSLTRMQIAKITTKTRKAALIHIQTAFRTYLEKSAFKKRLVKYKSSRRIQNFYRSYKKSSYFMKMKQAAAVIQATFRGFLTRHHRNTLESSAKTIQTKWRAFNKVKLYKKRLDFESKMKMKQAATVIQAIYRGSATRFRLKIFGISAKRIQTKWRSFIKVKLYQEKLALESKMQHIAAVVCQSNVRRWLANVKMMYSVNAVLTIQKNWRCYNLQSKYKIQQKQHNCALQIQCASRGMIVRSFTRKHKAAILIQKRWRGYVANVDYILFIISSIKLQALVRGRIAWKKHKTKVKAIHILQKWARGVMAKYRFELQINCILKLQKWLRIYAFRRRREVAARALQRFTRGLLCRNYFHNKKIAASKIQTVWRGYQSSTNFILIVLSVLKIQRIWRKTLFRRRIQIKRRRQLSKLSQVVVIEKVWRGHLARKKFSRTIQGFAAIQSIFRGNCVRKGNSRKICAVAKRIAQVNKIAKAEPEMTLGSRTSSALLILQTSKRLTEIMVAIQTLEISTRMSQKCCIAFTAAGAHNILYNLIRSCNRSLPHVELLQFILTTLSNVSKYLELISSIATNKGFDILLDLIQMFRDKDKIFCLASTLLELLVRNDDSLAMQCQKRENLKRITGVHNLCLKKVSLSKSNKSQSQAKFKGNISQEMSSGIKALRNIKKIASCCK